MDDNWVHALAVSEFPETGVSECVVDGKIIAIFRTDDGFHLSLIHI